MAYVNRLVQMCFSLSNVYTYLKIFVQLCGYRYTLFKICQHVNNVLQIDFFTYLLCHLQIAISSVNVVWHLSRCLEKHFAFYTNYLLSFVPFSTNRQKPFIFLPGSTNSAIFANRQIFTPSFQTLIFFLSIVQKLL